MVSLSMIAATIPGTLCLAMIGSSSGEMSRGGAATAPVEQTISSSVAQKVSACGGRRAGVPDPPFVLEIISSLSICDFLLCFLPCLGHHVGNLHRRAPLPF